MIAMVNALVNESPECFFMHLAQFEKQIDGRCHTEISAILIARNFSVI